MNSLKNRNINMSPKMHFGMEFNSFFGLNGALPMAFTERLLYLANEDNVSEFFNDLFVYYLTSKEQKYYNITHQYIRLFKKKDRTHGGKIKMIKIDRNFNNLGFSKLSRIVLGVKSPQEIYDSSKYNRISLCKIV
jgi:hypothetical protein